MSPKEDVLALDRSLLPEHIAIIMDGNRRWAKANGLSRINGHKEGANKLKEISKLVKELKIPYLTVYAFSSENWQRNKDEVDELRNLLKRFLKDSLKNLNETAIRVKVFGEYRKFGTDIVSLIEKLEVESSRYDTLQLNIALGYGGRNEILSAIKTLSPDDIANLTEDCFSKKLYTSEIPDPDLLIRTGGEMRISNFLLWQIAYSELFFSESLWPDFSTTEFCEIINSFSRRVRRFGF